MIPTNEVDRKKLKMMIGEMTNCMYRMDAEKEAKKEVAKAIKEQFELPTKAINRLANIMYKRNYNDYLAEEEDFQQLCEALLEGKGVDSE